MKKRIFSLKSTEDFEGTLSNVPGLHVKSVSIVQGFTTPWSQTGLKTPLSNGRKTD